MRIFELTTLEFGGTRFHRDLEFAALLGRQFVVIGQQHLHRDPLRQLDRLVEHDLPVLNVSSDRLHLDQDSRPHGISALGRAGCGSG